MIFRSLSTSYSKLTKLLVSLNFLWALSVISLFLKESEILEKSSVNESLKYSLLSSLLSDKIFGLSVQEVQEEMKKLSHSVKVNFQVINPPSGSTQRFPKKRKVDPPTTSSTSKPNISHKKKWAKKTGNRK
jgi:tetrahydromethanopterin S-methyltransferase subunit B